AGRKGPVLLNLPRDLLNETIDTDLAGPGAPRPAGPAADADLVARASRLLLAARRPVIVAGGGVVWSDAQAALLAVAERLAAPVVTSYGHNDAAPADHPLVIGAVGRAGSPEAAEAVRRADVILAAGTRLGHFTAFFDHRLVPRDATIVQIDVEAAALGRHYPAEVAILADARPALDQIRAALGSGDATDGRQRRAWVAAQRDARRRRVDQLGRTDARPIKPQRVAWELRQVLPRDAVVVLDAAAGAAPAYDMLDFVSPRSLLDSLDFGCVGCGFPLALGAKFAAPERPVVCLAGDGGFLMTSQDLETAVRFRLPVITIVLSNGCWGLEKAYQKHFFAGRYVGVDFANPPFDAYARVFGAEGWPVERPDQIRPVLEKALAVADRPVVIEIPVDPEELPYPARTEAIRADRTRST
ncbi:MAG: thiamine pyrophosphate-binding protein, partial [Candidatus Rokubacteria bacterium]|nr:thiamine pyrophosphate-binding protein [Candidatus Rokubacteria bacterium]